MRADGAIAHGGPTTPMTDPAAGGQPTRNATLVQFCLGHLAAVVAEWAVMIGVLVYAYDHGGERSAGLASLVLLAPYVLLASTTARLAERHRPAHLRMTALAVMAAGNGVAAIVAAVDGPTIVVVAGALLTITAETTLRPIGAVMLPAIVRSARELTLGNVRVGQAENMSVLLGPLAATALLALHGPAAVMAGCAALAAVALALTIPLRDAVPLATAPDVPHRARERRIGRLLMTVAASPFRDLVSVVRQPRASAVLVTEAGQYFLVGSLDIVLVVLAGDHLDLGPGGAGILNSLFGVGAVLSSLVARRAVTRPRLAALIVASLAFIGLGSLALGTAIAVTTAAIALPVLGIGRSLVSLAGRVLLQRAAPPSELAAVFGAIETASGIGLLLGSATTQIVIATAGVGATLVVNGALFVALAVVLLGPLRRVDDGADVPVVAMSLLGRLTLFEPLPQDALERVARRAVETTVPAGTVLVRQGDEGDLYYAIADGQVDVVVGERHVRTLERGDGFGEIALIADVPRTATVTARTAVSVLTLDRESFLLAVTGHESSGPAAWSVIDGLEFDGQAPVRPSTTE